MRRFIGITLALTLFGCEKGGTEAAPEAPGETARAAEPIEAAPETEREVEVEAEEERIAREYPIEGVVRLFQASVKGAPERGADTIGFIRRGVQVRAREAEGAGSGCKRRWLELHPEGYVCEGFEVAIGEELPEEHRDLTPPRDDRALPYDYYFVTIDDAPVMRRRPSAREREAVLEWLRRLRHYRRNEEKKLERFLEGDLEEEPARPRVVDRLLARGYYISSPKGLGAEGRYVRNAQGEYLFDDTLRKVDASELEGVVLDDEHQLPFGFLNRPARPLRVVETEEGVRFEEDPEEEALPRYTRLPGATPAMLVGDFLVHELPDGRVLKDWFVGVAERIEPPFAVEPGEPWIHIDLGEQTLVLYRGREPVYATLVSTGVDGHDTPEGVFRVDKKFVGRTMNDVSPDTPKGDRYRIEDVPYTQYFKGSYALHAAFWHDRFGTRRSHGCVNLSPHDAQVVFRATRPSLHEAWFGTYAHAADEAGTRIYITP